MYNHLQLTLSTFFLQKSFFNKTSLHVNCMDCGVHVQSIDQIRQSFIEQECVRMRVDKWDPFFEGDTTHCGCCANKFDLVHHEVTIPFSCGIHPSSKTICLGCLLVSFFSSTNKMLNAYSFFIYLSMQASMFYKKKLVDCQFCCEQMKTIEQFRTFPPFGRFMDVGAIFDQCKMFVWRQVKATQIYL